MSRVRIYMKYGHGYEYEVDSEEQAMRHARAIANDGYQRRVGEWTEFYGPDKVMKVKAHTPSIRQGYSDQPFLP